MLTCEHACKGLPRPLRPGPKERAVLDAHWGWDIGAWALTRDLARYLDASAVGGRWSRLFLDLNRRVDDPTLIRTEPDGVGLSWNRKLTAAEIERRILRCHAPYHDEVDRLLTRRLIRGVRPWLVAIHSFTPVWFGRRRDFEIGILYDRDRSAARQLAVRLRESGLSVRYNQPYSGMRGMMYSAERHGTHHGLTCLEIEVNQALLTGRRPPARLVRAIGRALRELTG